MAAPITSPRQFNSPPLLSPRELVPTTYLSILTPHDRQAEEEEELFSSHASLYCLKGMKEWVLRGEGVVKLLTQPNVHKCRILMLTSERLPRVLCSHVITPLMTLRPGQEKCQWIWCVSADYTTGATKSEWFRIQFSNQELSDKFNEIFTNSCSPLLQTPQTAEVEDELEECESPLPFVSPATNTKQVSVEEKQDEGEVMFSKEELPNPELVEKAVKLLLPRHFYLYLDRPDCPGCRGCEEDPVIEYYCSETEPAVEEHSETVSTQPLVIQKQAPEKDSEGLLFKGATGMLSFSDISNKEGFGFKFGESRGSAPFSFAGAGSQLFSNPTSGEGDGDDEYEPDVYFKPVVTLPEYNYQRRDEEAEVIFSERAKLYRYDAATKQWKERGIGEIKMLHYADRGNQVSLLMRREQILKVCCNHHITSDMVLVKHQDGDRVWRWTTQGLIIGLLTRKSPLLLYRSTSLNPFIILITFTVQHLLFEPLLPHLSSDN